MFCHKSQTFQYVFPESIFIEDSLIRRSGDDAGIRIEHRDAMIGPCHARCRIAMNRFRQYPFCRNLRQLFLYQLNIFFICVDKYMVGRHDLCHTVKGLLKLGAPHSKEVDKLLRIVAAAARPESAALTSRQYHTIIISVTLHILSLIFCWFSKFICKVSDYP